jgi:hypothetical protein
MNRAASTRVVRFISPPFRKKRQAFASKNLT